MLQDFPLSQEDSGKIVGREMLAALASVALYPLGLVSKKKRTAREQHQRTTVMIHGYLANRSSMLPLACYLKAKGLSSHLYFDYSSSIGIERAAIELKTFLKKHVRGGRIDLVCHSLGGLIARVYIQDMGGSRRVDNVITLGSPHHGTYNAYWVPSRIGRELRPDSPILARLNTAKESPCSVRFLSIVAGSDNIVIPRIFGSFSDDVTHIPSIGHLGLLFSPSVFKAVAKRLLGT